MEHGRAGYGERMVRGTRPIGRRASVYPNPNEFGPAEDGKPTFGSRERMFRIDTERKPITKAGVGRPEEYEQSSDVFTADRVRGSALMRLYGRPLYMEIATINRLTGDISGTACISRTARRTPPSSGKERAARLHRSSDLALRTAHARPKVSGATVRVRCTACLVSP